tara:strand:+ start:552 stop:743 length:192 start_codon:yes stop_codon:yes gene_type:complete
MNKKKTMPKTRSRFINDAKKCKTLKPCYDNSSTAELQFQVKKDVEADKKINPKKVFQNYKENK